MICKICNRNISNKGFGSHLSHTHHINGQEYYDTYIGTDEEKYCYCGNLNTFLGIQYGYSKHCSSKCSMNDLATTQKRIQTNLKKYGVENPFQSEQIKDTIKQTWLINYGEDNPNKSIEVKQKIISTNISKYGTKYPLQNKNIYDKAISSCEQHYGHKYPNQNLDIMNKAIYTRKETISKLESELDAIYVRTLINKYGSGWYQSPLNSIIFKYNNYLFVKRIDIEKIELYLKCNGSYVEYYVYNELLKYGIDFIHHDRQRIKPYELDFYLPELNIGIECNGYFHNDDCQRINRNNNEYHKIKFDLCNKNNIKLLNISDKDLYDYTIQERIEFLNESKEV